MDKFKIIKMLAVLAAITLLAGGLLRTLQNNAMSLADHERLNAQSSASEPESTKDDSGAGESLEKETAADLTDKLQDQTENPALSEDLSETPSASHPIGATINGTSQENERITYQQGFYCEPLSADLRRYITGVSYPVDTSDGGNAPIITLDELRYVHVLHYDFDGNPAEGELICNEYISQDLLEIFYELYRNEYQLEKIRLIDVYDGDDTASMEDNNTSCFNYRTVAGSKKLSKHAYGLAVDINPLYNPYITYGAGNTLSISPETALDYADRSGDFPYKIDEEDLCYKLFIQYGFTWGGNWNNVKDYQHFQKAKP